jgi:4-hydroxyphenylpyruvate dioxygenase
MSNGTGRIKFQSTNQPKERKIKSKNNTRFLWWPKYAIATDDIKTVSQLRARGVEFFSTATYSIRQYQNVGRTHGMMKEDQGEIERLAIMVMQMKMGIYCKFTKPGGLANLVFEIIQRMGAKGFGAGNFKALLNHRARTGLRGTL